MGAAARWISPSARDASHALRDIGRLEHHPKVLESADRAFRGEDLVSEVEGLPRVVPCDRPPEPISFLHAVGLSRRDQHRLQEPSADDPLLDAEACRGYAQGAETSFDERLTKERSAQR
jgi:hypothetical protein